MPAISVIVPTRKRNHLLPRALKSLLAQTFADFEVIVIDDNPPDSRVAAESALEGLLSDPRIRLIEHDQPRNAAAARNVGLRAARGHWITYLDDDDAYRPWKLEKQLECAESTHIPVGMCAVTYHLHRRQRSRGLSPQSLSGEELLLAFHALPALFHRNTRDVFFDEALSAGEDAYFFFGVLARLNLREIFYIPETLVDVYPQPGFRVNANGEGLWEANRAIHRDFAWHYGERISKVFLTRAQLQRYKLCPGGFFEIIRSSMLLLRLRGFKDVRLILNTVLFKIPWVRRFLVS